MALGRGTLCVLAQGEGRRTGELNGKKNLKLVERYLSPGKLKRGFLKPPVALEKNRGEGKESDREMKLLEPRSGEED